MPVRKNIPEIINIKMSEIISFLNIAVTISVKENSITFLIPKAKERRVSKNCTVNIAIIPCLEKVCLCTPILLVAATSIPAIIGKNTGKSVIMFFKSSFIF